MKKIIVVLTFAIFPIFLWGQSYRSEQKNEKYGLVDSDGNVVVPYNYSYVGKDVTDGRYVRVSRGDEKDGMYDIKLQKEVIPCVYDYIHISGESDKYVQVSRGKGKYGLYDIKLQKEVVPCVYDFVEIDIFCEDGYFKVQQASGNDIKHGLYDIQLKKEIIPCVYGSVACLMSLENRYFIVIDGNSKKWGLYDVKIRKEIIPCVYDVVGTDFVINDRYFAVFQNGRHGLYDIQLKKEVVPCKYDNVSNASENLILVKSGSKWGYVDITTGKEIISLQYDEAQPFDKGVARVKKDDKITLINNPLKEGNVIAAAPTSNTKKDPNAPAVSRYPAPNSDVDKDIPTVKTNENSALFAFIIANENYESAPVPYALNDGRMFKEYCQKTLGLPDKHIRMFEDASLGNIITAVEQLKRIATEYDGEASVIFYYAGHGVPDDKGNSAYLLPVDGSSSDITTTGYSLAKLYSELAKLPLRSVTVFLDACFSGATRENEILASARGVAVKVKDETPQGNMVVFSSATGDETAHQYEEKGHGLFTYFLLKKLQETKGNVSYGELSDYVTRQVKRHSVVINDKRQTPTVIPSPALADKWQTLKLK
ncbi:MAG: WG repeat-containing protein [Dysgonamonadaceae bacterium]|jgi:hypothetical protein|nr:WG repeat-containing protein [Dysgonamonadaceae bacterium]